MTRQNTKNSRKAEKEAASPGKVNEVTPTKPKTGHFKEKRFSLIVLNNGKQLPFKSLIYSDIYEKTNAAAISTVHRFQTEEEMEKY